MMPPLRQPAVLLLAAAALLLRPPGSAQAQPAPSAPAFTQTPCDLPSISPEMAPRLRCGTVAVPRDNARLELGNFRLAVVVIRSQTQPANADPVVYISGGPGGPLTRYADYQGRHPYAPDRDLILVDQRGVGRSEPRLCPDHAPQILEADLAVATNPSDEVRRQRRAVIMACAAEIHADGINLDDFGTAATVADFEAVRRALGLAQWNVYGESYGTAVAMTLMARHPETIRAAVLDSLYPPDPLPRWSERVAHARDTLFSFCQREAACARPFPNLAGQYRQAVSRLRQAPLSVPSPAFFAASGGSIALTASLFQVLLAQRLYSIDAYPGLPELIASVRAGQAGPASASVSAMLSTAQTLTLPAYIAVECRDRPSLRRPLRHRDAALDRFQIYGVCQDWSALGRPPVIPANTAIPTLILAGQFDPNVSPAMSRRVAERIGPHARWIGFPMQAHHVRSPTGCAAAIVADFIANPNAALDATCARQARLIQFRLPGQAPAR